MVRAARKDADRGDDFRAAVEESIGGLPRGLEYRFVGRNLALVDVKANRIVAYIEGLLPAGA